MLVNRSSGAGDGAEAGPRLAESAAVHGLDATILVDDGRNIAAEAARAVSAGASMLVAAGGDGTVSTLAAVAAAHGVVLGVVPLGTLNHFAKDLGIPTDLEAAVKTLAEGRTIAVDVGEVNGRTFLNNSSIGLYPRLVRERDRLRGHGRWKWTAMAIAAAHVWRQYRRMTVTVEGRGDRRHVRTPFVFIGNNEYAIQGGRIDARPRLDAGCLQLCMAPEADRAAMLRIVLAAIGGRLGEVNGFEAELASELTIAGRSRRLGVSLDGEVTVLDSPLRYRIRKQALRVRVPQPPSEPTTEPPSEEAS